MIRIFITCLTLLVLTTNSWAQDFQRSRAIVVGIDNYSNASSWADLKFAVADARALTIFLQRQGYDVTLLLDTQADRSAILAALRSAATDLGPQDRLLFYFGGHGHTDRLAGKEAGYLVPSGARDIGDMISMEEIRAMSQTMQAVRHQLFILNSCYGGTIGTLRGVMRSLDENRSDYRREIVKRQARQFIAAGGAEQQVLDGGPNGLSWFTHFFLEATQGAAADLDGDQTITFPELNAYLLPRASNSVQTPASGALPGHALGEYVFSVDASAGHTQVATVEPPTVTTTATRNLSQVSHDFVAMQQPVHNLFAAWEALDLDSYAAQWSPSAVQYVGRKKRRYATIIQKRAKLFPRLKSVKVERYQLFYNGHADGIASFDAAYSMVFRLKNGKVIRERERETYRTAKRGGRWVIIENRDYIR